MMGSSGGPRHVGLLSAHLVGWFSDALSVFVQQAHPVEWCRPRGGRRGGVEALRCAIFSASKKPLTANHSVFTSHSPKRPARH